MPGSTRVLSDGLSRTAFEFPQAGAPKSFDALEAELLNGQKLQGVLTSNEVQEILKARWVGLTRLETLSQGGVICGRMRSRLGDVMPRVAPTSKVPECVP
jgi:hypothetical protein